MAGIEAPRVACHGHPSAVLLRRHNGSCIRQAVRHRDFHLHMFARAKTCDGLSRMHLGGGAEDHRIDIGACEHLIEFGRGMRNAVFLRELAGFFGQASHH
jgi:hypothetical protein